MGFQFQPCEFNFILRKTNSSCYRAPCFTVVTVVALSLLFVSDVVFAAVFCLLLYIVHVLL